MILGITRTVKVGHSSCIKPSSVQLYLHIRRLSPRALLESEAEMSQISNLCNLDLRHCN
ncbi:uncharacterized protein PHALS_00269 [Plasmopara halstedii]|uniref:Uncharacterized protein n=1 Tax=Plasmopara halstedii TaxID=4781 RepID=A0A0P1A5T3_PLAHL|nr:uncharacterized protein PHALS_00269 [Plasmopara halstedii]CEG35946.1 hypothetical protein PHALS_00269 [Plasmopara halstedii]|eukprot:XP_024572315.1 hypothetical protein PHALS_00269 [Plasmopara halstedii]